MSDNDKQPLRISIEEAHSRAENVAVTFLDVVDPEAYEKKDYQITSAVRIDPRDIEDEYQQLSRENLILTYCT